MTDYYKACQVTPDQHVLGATSLFMFWTMDKSIAEKLARGKNNDKKGVVLTLKVNTADLIDSKVSREFFSVDVEFLLYGVRRADKVENIVPLKKH